MLRKLIDLFKKNPTKVRTSEVSQVQDAVKDPQTRSPERKAFDEKVADSARKGLRGA